jgi:hypothetical protein
MQPPTGPDPLPVTADEFVQMLVANKTRKIALAEKGLIRAASSNSISDDTAAWEALEQSRARAAEEQEMLRSALLYKGPDVFDQKMTELTGIMSAMQNVRSPNGIPHKALIFSSCQEERLSNMLCDIGMRGLRLTRSRKPEEVDALINSFKNDADCRFLIVNPGAYGRGLEMQFVHKCIVMHTMPVELLHQVIGRAQRPPRSENLQVHILLNAGEDPDLLAAREKLSCPTIRKVTIGESSVEEMMDELEEAAMDELEEAAQDENDVINDAYDAMQDNDIELFDMPDLSALS